MKLNQGGFNDIGGSRELWGLVCWYEPLGGIIVLLANVSLDSTVAGE